MKETYPLEQLAMIKKRRLEEAERVLKEKKLLLAKEQEKQKQLEEDRNTTFKHRAAKMKQLRDKLDEGTTSDKIEIMRDYIKVVDDELKQKEKKVQEQLKVVEAAEQAVEAARKDMIKKQHDVEKMKMHRKEWEKEMRVLEIHAEGVETDDLGTAMHSTKKRKR
jgi:flagellar biosynthesis chaperone FliJ